MILDRRDGAVIRLLGVSKGSKHLLIRGEAVAVDILKTLPKLEGPRRPQLRGIDRLLGPFADTVAQAWIDLGLPEPVGLPRRP